MALKPYHDNHLEITMIRYLLLHRIEDTDKHPRLMFALAMVVICCALALDPSVPQ